ncbi:MAG: M20/M25/M40 family metallo-hydrolase [Alphaproteobacteria bacterium]|nr:M20/M25/M40 family metallo-hydrolase [Alphaproteobacteria bacterium]
MRGVPLGCLLATACVAPGPDGDVVDPDAVAPWDPPSLSGVLPGAPAPSALREAVVAGLEGLALAGADGTRAVATPGYAASVDHVVARLEAVGLEPVLAFTRVKAWRILGQGLDGPDGPVPAELLGVLRGSPAGEVQAPLVHVDLLVPDGIGSACEDDDLLGFPPGAVAVVRRGGCFHVDKVQRAADAGAVAVIVVQDGREPPHVPTYGSLGDAPPAGVPVVGAAADALAWLPEGGIGRVRVDSQLLDEDVPSVLVDLPGDDGAVWMAGAHLDSVTAGPGLNDNGSGVAAVLAVAEALAAAPEGRHPVRLAFWGAEELGLLGSRALVDEGLADDVVAYLNVDMVGSPNGRHMVYDVDGDELERTIGAFLPLEAALEDALRDALARRGWPVAQAVVEGRSDHTGFTLAGVPVGGVFTGAGLPLPDTWVERHGGEAGVAHDACYHAACDTLANVDVARVEGAAAALLDVLRDARVGRFDEAAAASWGAVAPPVLALQDGPDGCMGPQPRR